MGFIRYNLWHLQNAKKVIQIAVKVKQFFRQPYLWSLAEALYIENAQSSLVSFSPSPHPSRGAIYTILLNQ